MGRRSINTTKSGKYMNPTDQARKEARKQELKKNKKQRQMVRAAVLKGKDPQQLLEEMEKIDQMEFNVNQPSPLNEKVLKDKRKKLRDTLERVLSMHYKDDPDKWADLKRRQTEYEHKRNQLVAFYESVRSAQQVQVDEIPLPQLPQQLPTSMPAQIPLPAERKQEHTIYSIATALKLQALGQPVREPPGCPPGPPPDINDDGEIEEFGTIITTSTKTISDDIANNEKDDLMNDEEDDEDDENSNNKPTSLQQKMVAISGQNVDDFMKEMEVVQKKMESNGGKDEEKQQKIEILVPPGTDLIPQQLPQQQQQQPPQQLPPPSAVIANPPGPPSLIFPPVGGLRLPPGPPPGRPLMPPGPPPGLPPPPRIPLRMPPAPPRMIRLPGPPPNLAGAPPNLHPSLATPNVLTAGPQLIGRNDGMIGLVVGGGNKQQTGATITAKPQIRNLSADVTRFVPSALRVKREDKKINKTNTRALVNELKQKEYHFHKSVHSGQHTKDDAYKQFMEEMQNLL